jgi:hypothetical protein
VVGGWEHTRRAELGGEHERGHEGELAQDGQDHAVPEGEELVGDAHRCVQVVDQDQLGQAQLQQTTNDISSKRVSGV